MAKTAPLLSTPDTTALYGGPDPVALSDLPASVASVATDYAAGKVAPSGLPSNVGARTARFDPTRCLYNATPANTKRLKTALAHGLLNDALAGLLFVGDSKTAGFNGTLILGAKGWPGKVASLLGAQGFTIAGTGVVNPTQNQTAPASVDSRWTLVNFAGGGTNNAFVSATVNGATATFVSDRAGTNVDIYSLGTSAPFTVTIDGVSQGTVTPTGGNVLYKKSYTGLSNAVHTVVITTTGTVVTYVMGCNVFNSTGLQFHNYGISSSKASPDWANTGQYYQALQVTKQLPATVAFISLGVNDCQGNISLASFNTAMSGTIVPTYQGVGMDVVLVVETPASTAHQGAAVNWDAFVSAQYDLADSLNLPLIDLTNLYGASNATAQASGWMASDGLHELEVGYQINARAIASALLSL